MSEREQRNALQLLADELTRRGWIAHMPSRSKVVLEVTNPARGAGSEPALTETVRCQDAAGGTGLAFCLPGGHVVGPATDVDAAADQIQHVLRSVGQ